MGTAEADVLVDDAPRRLRRLAAVGGAVLLVLVAGAAALRSTLPPPALEVGLEGLSGTALRGDSFIRLHLTLEASGARSLEDAVLTVAGTTQRGQHPPSFDDGRVTVQVDLTPDCASLPQQPFAGVLDLQVQDAGGSGRRVLLDVPAAPQLERLVRFRCGSGGESAG